MTVNVRHWVSQRSIPWAVCFVVAGAGLGLTMLKMYWSPASQAERPPQVVEIVQQPNLPGAVLVNNQPIHVGNSLTLGQQLTTQAGAKVALQKMDGEGARLGSGSSLMIEKGCLQLGDGNAVMSGLSGCLGAIIVNSTKGIYTLERVNYSAEIKVLAGQVEVSVPRNRAAQLITLQDNQKITIGLTGDEVGPIRLMLPSEVQHIVNGNLFQGFQIPLPNQAEIKELRISPIAPSPIPSPSIKPTKITPTPTPTPAPTPVKPAATPPASGESSDQPPVSRHPSRHAPGCS